MKELKNLQVGDVIHDYDLSKDLMILYKDTQEDTVATALGDVDVNKHHITWYPAWPDTSQEERVVIPTPNLDDHVVMDKCFQFKYKGHDCYFEACIDCVSKEKLKEKINGNQGFFSDKYVCFIESNIFDTSEEVPHAEMIPYFSLGATIDLGEGQKVPKYWLTYIDTFLKEHPDF